MGYLMKELIDSVNNLNKFSWSDAIALASLLIPSITIIILLIERSEAKRPYLQITFELVRDNLACIVLRNVGNVPLEIKSILFDEEFVNQLPEKDRYGLNDDNLNKIVIFPNKQWILSLGVIIPEILEKYELTTLNIYYSYSKINKKKKYDDLAKIDFKQYSRFMVYVSEIDELKEQFKKTEKELKLTNKEIKNISAIITKYSNLEDKHVSNIVSGYKIDKE